ncbi:hypothetical protein EYF80_060447 [Liparis tanakae]|uniref:Uncharacterized protein n=1 Tax=Liparis tanakae TaxID=230148 RepID=A0A4Z2ELU1_9TELE|nr:hypothetical protein EYF80_060447 [Liparis tanakae]
MNSSTESKYPPTDSKPSLREFIPHSAFSSSACEPSEAWGGGGGGGGGGDRRAVEEQAQQERSSEGPAGHSEDVFRYRSPRGEPSRLSGLHFEPDTGDGLRCGGTKSGHYLKKKIAHDEQNNMDFANLFSGLSAVAEGVKRPGEPASAHRNDTENGQRGNARKRNIQVEQTGSYKKKQRYDGQTPRSCDAPSFRADEPDAPHPHAHPPTHPHAHPHAHPHTHPPTHPHTHPHAHPHTHNTHTAHARAGFPKQGTHNQNYKAGHNQKGQNYTAKNNPHVNNNNNNNNKQQKKKPEGQKNHHQQKDRWKPGNKGGRMQPPWGRGGRYGGNRNDTQDLQETHKRSMTQEFMDQNGVLVDGRLICRHFLMGRCIKAGLKNIYIYIYI